MQAAKKSGGIDAFWLKAIAIVGMTLDHTGIVFAEQLLLWEKTALYALGGLTFPIMAFLLCEGYRHTRDVRKYMLRLLVFALIAQAPYMWALAKQLNVLFTLLLGLLAIHWTQRTESRILRIAVAVGLTALSLVCDWGGIGVPMILCCYYAKTPVKKVVTPLLVAAPIAGIAPLIALVGGNLDALPGVCYFFVGAALTIPLLLHYNGQRGKPLRYFFYAYYPLHIAALGLLHGLMTGTWGIW